MPWNHGLITSNHHGYSLSNETSLMIWRQK